MLDKVNTLSDVSTKDDFSTSITSLFEISITFLLLLSSLVSLNFSVSLNSAIGVLIFIPWVPSSTISFEIKPSSIASISIVALSVSISAIKSPELILSPTLTNHFASVPSSIVGLKAGINISLFLIIL